MYGIEHFKFAGRWMKDGDGKIHAVMNEPKFGKHCWLVYAFTTKRVKYIGKTERTLSEMMLSYRNADPSQKTNMRIRSKIMRHLNNENPILIHIFPIDIGNKFNSREILEELKIESIRNANPEWNIRKIAEFIADITY